MLTLSVLTVLLSVATLALTLSISEDGHYDTRYNHLDIERILNNKRLVTYYAQCLTGDGPCTPQGTEFKRILPEALRTNCARCTEKQKITAYLAIRRLKKEYPKIWQELQAAWDPKGEYVSTFINTVESSNGGNGNVKPVTPGAERPADNEITKEAPAVPLPRGIPKLEASTTTTTRVEATQKLSTTTENYRTSFRPTSDLINQATQTTPRPTTTSTTIQKIPPRTSSTTQSSIPSMDSNFKESVQSTSLVIDLLNNQATRTTTAVSKTTETSTTQNIPPVILSRGGPNESTTDSNDGTSNRPTSGVNNQATQTTTTTRPTITTQNIPRIIPSNARPNIPTSDNTNYRISYRPTRFNILLPRPQDIGRLTANVIGSIGDIGTKVIRTGARIADMVLTGVQAGVQATIGRIQQ